MRVETGTTSILALVLPLLVAAPSWSQSPTPASTSRQAPGQDPAADGGDPDRPVITGRVPNPASAGPVEVLRQTVERGRLVLVDLRGGRHLVPDGAYGGLTKGGNIVIRGKKITVKGSKDVVLKGSKIPENGAPSPGGGGTSEIRLDDDGGTLPLSRLPDDTYRSTTGASLVLRTGRIVGLQGF